MHCPTGRSAGLPILVSHALLHERQTPRIRPEGSWRYPRSAVRVSPMSSVRNARSTVSSPRQPIIFRFPPGLPNWNPAATQ